ncbi:hypothetical protein [Desulfonatronospira sp.]|uniref:hypothetical protein n=1 Tax=Desulfonatronospira sp. TaxID=1962951 RepID=UPI0025BF3584|nr:hypothetical protein [Desulfonatronospira sp.]
MKDFSFSEVLGLLMKTLPFLVFRFLIYFAITLGFVIITGTGAGIGYGVGSIADKAAAGGMWGGLAGFGLAAAIMYFIREYLLYLVKAGHIAVLVELLDGKEIPGGKGQIDYARQQVQKRFSSSTVLFGLDQLIKGILRSFNRVFLSIASILPIPGAAGAMKIINTIVTLSLTYLDEVILAYLMKTRSENPWASSRTALILYAQNYKSFLKNAVWLALFIWASTFVVFLVVLGPVALLVGLFPGTAGPLTLIVALVFAWGIKQAVIEPIGMTALMLVYFKVTEGQTANPEWEAKLSNVSSKFKDLKDKASAWQGQKHDQPAQQTLRAGQG